MIRHILLYGSWGMGYAMVSGTVAHYWRRLLIWAWQRDEPLVSAIAGAWWPISIFVLGGLAPFLALRKAEIYALGKQELAARTRANMERLEQAALGSGNDDEIERILREIDEEQKQSHRFDMKKGEWVPRDR